MKVAYWVVATLLALLYLYSGGLKIVRSKDQLRPMMGWIVLPPLAGVAPGLPLASAIGLVLLQVGGISLHLSRGEARLIGLNIVLLALAGVAVWLSTSWL